MVETYGRRLPRAARPSATTIERWAAAEEEGFGRTLAQGERLLAELIERAKAEGTSWVVAEDAFRLHDTYGFPYEMTKELLAEEGLAVDDQGFEELMEQAREVRARAGATRARRRRGTEARAGARRSPAPPASRRRFVGYESTEAETVIGARRARERRACSPSSRRARSTPRAAGRCPTPGVVETPSGRARVVDVYRLGDDQALALEPRRGRASAPGEAAHARRGARARGSPRCATTPPPTSCTPRCASGSAPHVRQAGSYVGPDKLRFDFTHGERLSDEELRDVEDRVNGWVADNQPVRAIETTREEAEALGAMALFGEKYGDWVRMVEVEDVSRELCGGHARGVDRRGRAVPHDRPRPRAPRTCAGSRR